MPEQTLLEMPRLEERVRAAARLLPRKEVGWRRLATRERGDFKGRASEWMVPLLNPAPGCYAVELVPCDADEPGAVSLHKDELPEQIRLSAQVLYDLWVEQLPMDVLSEVMP